MTEALKLCPFCGAEAEFKPYKQDGLTLKCKSLGCVVFNQRTLRYSLDWLRDKMVESWNARATPAPAQPEVPAALYGVSNDHIDWRLVGVLIEAHMSAARHHTPGTSNWGAWLYKALVKAVREAGAAAPVEAVATGWVNVKDRLPEPWIEVLVHPRPTDACCEGYVDRSGSWQYTQHDSWGCNPRACVVTHWFAPPAAPKEKP